MDENEIKNECDYNYHLQCCTCLSVGRKLMSLGMYVEIYRKLTSNMEFNNLQPTEQLQVCWECRALLQKAVRFQQRVERANEAIRSGQVHIYGILSSLTAIILNETHPHTIYIDNQINTEPEITKCETNKDLEQEFSNDDFSEVYETADKDVFPQEFDNSGSDIKTDLKLDVEITSKSKIVNRWAQKRAQQNKKPKFRILTNKDINKLIRIQKMDDIDLEKYLESSKLHESHISKTTCCESCIKGFKNKNDCMKHYKNNQISKDCKKYLCLVCEYHTCCKKEIEEHAGRHKRVFQCLKCELMFSNRREFYKHFKDWHEKFVCDYCGISFKMRYCIKDHIRKQHSPFECVPCNKRFARYNGLWLHNKIHHTAPSSAGYCVECDRQYPDVYRYRWHLANSARHKPRKKTRIPCPGCDKVFSKNIYMKDHYNLVHLKCYKYRCEDCDKNFIRNADLVKHRRRVHDGILPPKNKICYMCGRGFTTNKILMNHIRTHTGEKPFACAHCPAAFAQKAALRGHARALHRAHDTHAQT